MKASDDDHDELFETRRQAYGYLVSQWSAYVAGILAMVVFVFGSPPGLAGGIAVFVLALILLAGMVWGWRARGEMSRERVIAAIHERRIRWWDRDTFVADRAARRVRWHPPVVLWFNRSLIVVGAALVAATTVELVRTIAV